MAKSRILDVERQEMDFAKNVEKCGKMWKNVQKCGKMWKNVEGDRVWSSMATLSCDHNAQNQSVA